jgi:hypothetical protein
MKRVCANAGEDEFNAVGLAFSEGWSGGGWKRKAGEGGLEGSEMDPPLSGWRVMGVDIWTQEGCLPAKLDCGGQSRAGTSGEDSVGHAWFEAEIGMVGSERGRAAHGRQGCGYDSWKR